MQRFRRLVETHRDHVFSLAFYLLNDRMEAEDVSQEVLLRLWKKLPDLDQEGLKSWLTKVTRHACIDAYRKRRTLKTVVEIDSEGLAFAQAPAREPLPDAETEERDFQSKLRTAIAALPEPHRSIVVLREVEELKYGEIAELLSLPLNTVKVYLHRARIMLREEMRKRLDYVDR